MSPKPFAPPPVSSRLRSRLLVVFTLALALLPASRVRVAATSDIPVYGRLYNQTIVFTTTLSSASTTGGSIPATDARRFYPGQVAQVWLACSDIRSLPDQQPTDPWSRCYTDDSYTEFPAKVYLLTVDASTGALTWVSNADWDLPVAPGPGARFESVLDGPGNLSVDAAGHTYVVDTWNSRIAVFDADGTPLYTIGHYGSVYTVLDDPTDANGDGLPDNPMNGYPATGTNAVCYDALGNIVAPDSNDCPNDPTKLRGLFNYPNDISVASDGTLVVADAGNHRIQLLKPDPSGTIVASDGTTRFSASTFGTWALGLGVAVGKMSFPGGVGTGPGGRIAVADTDNSRIEVFDPSSTGTIVASDGTKYSGFAFGQHGESNDAALSALEFNYPLDVAIDSTGRIIVADSGNNQVKVYETSGTTATDIALLGNVAGLDPGQFNYPWGVGADASGNLLVADTFGQRIQVLPRTATGYDVNTPMQLPAIQSPVGVASTPAGGYVVTEFEGHRIVRLAPLGLTVQSPVSITASNVKSGDQVPVTFTVVNSGMVPLANVQPQLTGATTVACSGTPSPPAPTALAVNGAATFTLCFTAGDPNTTMHVQVSATGWAGEMLETANAKPAPDVNVLPAGAALGLTATALPSRVQVNNSVTVSVKLTNQGSVALTGVHLTLGSIQGLTFQAAVSDSLSRPDIPVGGTQTLSFRFTATQAEPAQSLSIAADANEINPDTGLAVHASAAVSIEVVTDVDPPVITRVQVTGPHGEAPNGFGWIQYGPAYLTVTAADSGTGLASINYRAITLQSGFQSFSGQNSGSVVSTGFLSHGQGNTLVAFWAEDLAGNAALHGLMPAAGETVQAFCTRLPAQCVSINVDPLAPFLDHWPVQISDDNTKALIRFNASDSQSGVWTVARAYPQPDASIVMDPDSNSRGTLILTSEGPTVYGDVTVTDFAGLQSTFRLPFQGQGKPALRLDRTPPEAFNRVDPTALGARCSSTTPDGVPFQYWCTNKVYGTDNLPGFTTSAFAPISVLPVRWGGDDSSPVDSRFDGIAELHTYSFTDEYVPSTGPEPIQNPNRATLVEKVRQDGNEARVRVMSYQYTTGKIAGPVIVPDWAYKKYEWAKNRDGSLKTLNQKFELHRGQDRWQVLANYDARSNTTTIRDLGPHPERREVLPGLVLLEMTTAKGSLIIRYPGSTPPPATTGTHE